MNDFNDTIAIRRNTFSASRRKDSRDMNALLEQARQFLFGAHLAALGTLSDQHPYVSSVNMVANNDGRVLIQVSQLAEHSRNLEHNSACSLLITTEGAEDLQESPRLTLIGQAERVPATEAERYLRLYPHTRAYLEMDFHFLALGIERARWIPGFARATWLSGTELGAPLPWDQQVEQSMVDHMNEDHADAIHRYLRLLGEQAEQVGMAAMDPWGFWLLADGRPLRFPFESPALTPADIRSTLVELAQIPV